MDILKNDDITLMEQRVFQQFFKDHAQVVEQIREAAHHLHDSVNQRYAVFHPYGYHLDMVANCVQKYGDVVCARAEDVLPLIFSAYYHDSIEDARLTYNDVVKEARHYMDDQQAVMAAEIVYALTNDKGRTRAERAGEKYYQGIRETPYAPFVKLADRLANLTYSCQHNDALNARMRLVYGEEMPHFLAAIDAHSEDPRFCLPQDMLEDVYALV